MPVWTAGLSRSPTNDLQHSSDVTQLPYQISSSRRSKARLRCRRRRARGSSVPSAHSTQIVRECAHWEEQQTDTSCRRLRFSSRGTRGWRALFAGFDAYTCKNADRSRLRRTGTQGSVSTVRSQNARARERSESTQRRPRTDGIRNATTLQVCIIRPFQKLHHKT